MHAARYRQRTSAAGRLALAMLCILAAGALVASARAGGANPCSECLGSASGLSIDPSSYRVWPSGARTLTSVSWSPDGSTASIIIRNSGDQPSGPLSVSVRVDNHDPISGTIEDGRTYDVPIPALAPGESATITVPLDYSQCDIFLTVDLGDGNPTVLRTGNPAAC